MEFKYESVQDSETIVKYLTALRDGFADGKLILTAENKQLVLEPKGLLDFEIKSKRKDEEHRISIKVSWRVGGKKKSPRSSAFRIDTDQSDNA